MRETTVRASGFSNIASIYDYFARHFPDLNKYRASALFAVNSDFADPETPVRDGDEVAFFPPVSGG